MVSIPAILISGPLLGRFLKKVEAKPLKEFLSTTHFQKDELPSLWNSISTALLPVVLIGGATLTKEIIAENHPFYRPITFLGNPVVALLVAVLVSIFSLGLLRGQRMKATMQSFNESLTGITSVLLIIAGAGGLKQILIDSGVSESLGTLSLIHI